MGLIVIFLFRLGENLIMAEKAKFSKTMLSDSTLLVIVVYMFLILGHFGGGTAVFFWF
jgi:hypothetical protein